MMASTTLGRFIISLVFWMVAMAVAVNAYEMDKITFITGAVAGIITTWIQQIGLE